MWDLNIKFCPKFRLICIAQNYAHLCKYIIFKNNNFFSKYMYFVIITIKPRLPETSLMKWSTCITVIVFNKGTYVSELLSKKLWSHSRVPTGSHHNSIIFSENRYFFTYLVCTCTYLCQWPFTIRNVCISLLLCWKFYGMCTW